jgi:hypothetical protein
VAVRARQHFEPSERRGRRCSPISGGALLTEKDAVPTTMLCGGGGRDLTLRGGALEESTSSILPKQCRANCTLVLGARREDRKTAV